MDYLKLFEEKFDHNKKIMVIKNLLEQPNNKKCSHACDFLISSGIVATIIYPFLFQGINSNVQSFISNFTTIISLGFIFISYYFTKSSFYSYQENDRVEACNILMSMIEDSYEEYEKLGEKYTALLDDYKLLSESGKIKPNN